MFFAEGQIRVHLYGHPCDMRKSFPGLYALTLQGLRADPLSPGGRPTSPMPGRLKLLHPEVERAPVGAEG
jgi:hypothetical protein